MASGKSPSAFLTIGELSARLGVPQHILRYWETRFPQLKPVQRAGNRRYYRPEDVALAERIHRLLGTEGYTVKGVQQLLAKKGGDETVSALAPIAASAGVDTAVLVRIRDTLKAALAA